jgi:hypothetical protein
MADWQCGGDTALYSLYLEVRRYCLCNERSRTGSIVDLISFALQWKSLPHPTLTKRPLKVRHST